MRQALLRFCDGVACAQAWQNFPSRSAACSRLSVRSSAGFNRAISAAHDWVPLRQILFAGLVAKLIHVFAPGKFRPRRGTVSLGIVQDACVFTCVFQNTTLVIFGCQLPPACVPPIASRMCTTWRMWQVVKTIRSTCIFSAFFALIRQWRIRRVGLQAPTYHALARLDSTRRECISGIVDYDPGWSEKYEVEKSRILAARGEHLKRDDYVQKPKPDGYSVRYLGYGL